MIDDDTNYKVEIEDFVKNHYSKYLEKKYKNYWYETMDSVIQILSRFDISESKINGLDCITEINKLYIYKYPIKIAGNKESAKTGGCRCILSVNKEIKIIKILLIYTKDDIVGNNETLWFKKMIRNNYEDYKNINLN